MAGLFSVLFWGVILSVLPCVYMQNVSFSVMQLSQSDTCTVILLSFMILFCTSTLCPKLMDALSCQCGKSWEQRCYIIIYNLFMHAIMPHLKNTQSICTHSYPNRINSQTSLLLFIREVYSRCSLFCMHCLLFLQNRNYNSILFQLFLLLK